MAARDAVTEIPVISLSRQQGNLVFQMSALARTALG
jgi:hypothetical protein